MSRRGVAAQFPLIKRKQRFIRDRQRQHFFALFAGGFRLRTMWRNVIGHDGDALQADLIRQNFHRLQMPVMYRVKVPPYSACKECISSINKNVCQRLVAEQQERLSSSAQTDWP
jgi:hypothetical protein